MNNKTSYKGFPSKEAYVLWKVFELDGNTVAGMEFIRALEPDKFKEVDKDIQM